MMGAMEAATKGALEVGLPVTLAVLTTCMAFMPLANVEGMMGKFMYNIPVVVIAILLFSLVESLLILPAHLATMKSVVQQEQDRDLLRVRCFPVQENDGFQIWEISLDGLYLVSLVPGDDSHPTP